MASRRCDVAPAWVNSQSVRYLIPRWEFRVNDLRQDEERILQPFRKSEIYSESPRGSPTRLKTTDSWNWRYDSSAVPERHVSISYPLLFSHHGTYTKTPRRSCQRPRCILLASSAISRPRLLVCRTLSRFAESSRALLHPRRDTMMSLGWQSNRFATYL